MTVRHPVPETAMLLAAGRGERLRPITDTIPKPLVAVGGQPMLDHALDRLAAAGVRRAVINVWHLGAQIEAHLAARRVPEITISREDVALETGGGIVRALPMLGPAPFLVVNGDSLWLDGARDTVKRLASGWDDDAMDMLLLVTATARAVGFSGLGDYTMDPLGRLTRRLEGRVAPYVYSGLAITHPRLFEAAPAGSFSLNRLFDKAEQAGRLFGVVHDGLWYHVGTPADLDAVRLRFANGHAPAVPFF